jgi:hypothetical protein
MSWVRYDDGFDSHPKVTAVVAEDPGAVALHTLANTWSSRQKRPGFVPSHQPGVLVGKARGKRWAALLERHGLWDAVEGGWEFHDHADYRENRKRTTAGTPAELSAKRAEAGRKGGKAAQQDKQTGKQTVQQNQQPSGFADSPVVDPNGSTPVPVPTTSAFARNPEQTGTPTQRSKAITDAYVERVPLSNWNGVNALVLKGVRSGRYADQELRDAVLRLADEGRPVTADTLRIAMEGIAPPARAAPNKAEQRTASNVALAQRLRAEESQKEIG